MGCNDAVQSSTFVISLHRLGIFDVQCFTMKLKYWPSLITGKHLPSDDVGTASTNPCIFGAKSVSTPCNFYWSCYRCQWNAWRKRRQGPDQPPHPTAVTPLLTTAKQPETWYCTDYAMRFESLARTEAIRARWDVMTQYRVLLS